MTTGESLATWTPRSMPGQVPLEGRYVTLVPTDPGRDAGGLYAATREGDPALWNYLSVGPFDSEDAFASWLRGHVDNPSLVPMTVIVNASGAPMGTASYIRIEPAQGVLEIGHIIFGKGLQRSTAATEAISLLLRHAFDDLGYRRVEWKCDAANARSRRAAERFGFRFEGIFRQHMIVKGRNRDTAWFSIIDGEWPAVKAAFEAWLAPGNFDTAGRQIRRLEEFRAP